MGDMGDFWHDVRHAQRARRIKRLPVRTRHILELERDGYIITPMTPYQFRVNGCLDLYPTHNRWHDLRSNTRGGAADLIEFVRRRLPLAQSNGTP